MSWSNVDIRKIEDTKENKENKAKAAELAKLYNRCFGTEEGQKVLQDLTSRFIYNNDVSFEAKNVDYEAAYCNGEGSVVKFIINRVSRAAEL